MSPDPFLRSMGLAHPLMAAPMGGGPSTPELVAIVSDSGGMGWIAGAYLTPAEIVAQAERVRALTDRPFGINLSAGAWRRSFDEDRLGPMMALIAEAHAALGLEPPV